MKIGNNKVIPPMPIEVISNDAHELACVLGLQVEIYEDHIVFLGLPVVDDVTGVSEIPKIVLSNNPAVLYAFAELITRIRAIIQFNNSPITQSNSN